MEIKHIKELMSVMNRTGTKRLVLKKEGVELELEQQSNHTIATITQAPDEVIHHRHERLLPRSEIPLSHVKENVIIHHSHPPETQEETAGVYVTSPMVGTFYSAPSPEDPSFVKVGDKIEKHTVVCIVEAMKVMNEVKAGVSGTVAEVLIESGQPVEFGTKLFRIT